ncbi:MAG TPA: M23 family metallopeptidase [Myxococcaceae bacterium]|nr:M23 family metallopeptidase [Myxococcaceae bacterium]
MSRLNIPLGQSSRQGGSGKFLVFFLMLAAGGGGVWWWRKNHAPPPPPAVAVAPVVQPVAPPPAPVDPLVKAGLKHASVRINGPLEAALVESAGREIGPALAQVVTRALVWWVDVPGDFRKGDALDVLYEERAGQEPLVHAVRFESSKMAKSFRAYRFQPKGDPFARYYQPSGEEMEMRLRPSPLDDYEQVTSLIRDGRRHKGVDFKTPVGTPVKSTLAGVITRKNWNWRSNGNCLEVSEAGGRKKALFLHLAELPKSVKVGDRVVVGQTIAQSGNSGHSFAPHLHYQLMAGEERVLDPFETHGSYRRSVAVEAKSALDVEVKRLDGLMDGAAGSTLATK